MAVDDDDNEVDGNGMTEAAAAGRMNAARVTGRRDAGELLRGRGGFFSGVL